MSTAIRAFFALFFMQTVQSSMIDTATNSSIIPEMSMRLQWNENNGYCGECSLISSGMLFGQFMSQYDARVIADSKGRPSSTPQTSTQVLIGSNDEYTVDQMKMKSISWSSSHGDASDYLAWVKKMWLSGYPVTICVYMNYYLFYGITKPSAGDADYDHIVSVTGIESKYNDEAYHDDDVLTFSDHGLWNPKNSKTPQYLFSYSFKDFQGDRATANAETGSVYTLPNTKSIGNYGVAITGVQDLNGDTLPITIKSQYTYEDPEIKPNGNTRPVAMSQDLTVTVAGLTAGQSYRLYCYDSEAAVPTSAFNKNSNDTGGVRVWPFTAAGTSYVMTDRSRSSAVKSIYRAVRADAP